MRKVVILGAAIAIGLALGGAAAAAGKKKAKAKKAKAACLKAGDAKIQKAEADAQKTTQAAFEAELKQQGLTLAPLAGHQVSLHQGINEDWGSTPTQNSSHTFGEKFDDTVEKVKGTYIAGPIYWTGSAQPPEQLEFVQDDKGNLYRLERKATSGTVTVFKMCDCQPYQCGSGCPACGSTIQIVYGPIPAGSTYKGPISVSYVMDGVSLQYTGVCKVNCPP